MYSVVKRIFQHVLLLEWRNNQSTQTNKNRHPHKNKQAFKKCYDFIKQTSCSNLYINKLSCQLTKNESFSQSDCMICFAKIVHALSAIPLWTFITLHNKRVSDVINATAGPCKSGCVGSVVLHPELAGKVPQSGRLGVPRVNSTALGEVDTFLKVKILLKQ